ncbi:unnamed protein product [Moneuplotes crassus]|uniref:Uncharacterized protein n=1 Tax=Euplotes crassus TaxID=5936 RepID=A0AAD1U5C5_EUPCR|nr:unnamed protein product [Moneuplotes crassus]
MEEQKTNKVKNKIQIASGRWSSQEHQLFIECLQKYGKDWSRLEKCVPTRTKIQIRSHAQNFFENIKREFNISNPMNFIMNQPQDIRSKNQNEHRRLVSNSQRMPNNHSNNPYPDRTQERLDISERHKRKRRSEESYNRSSEQRLQSSSKYFKDQKGEHINASTAVNSAYVCLNRGDVIIKANEIETIIPCDIENSTLPSGKSVPHIFPNQQVNITILPLSKSTVPMAYDVKSKGFTCANQTPQAPKPVPNFGSHLTPFQQGLLQTFNKLFCLKDYNINCSGPPNHPSSPSINISPAQNYVLNSISQSLSSDRISESSNSSNNSQNSQPINPNKTNLDYFKVNKISHKNSNSDEVSKKL